MKKPLKRSPVLRHSQAVEANDQRIPAQVRPIASLWLVVHLFCICLTLSANLLPSELQMRLLRAIGPYASALNQAYGMLPFEMVQGSEHDHPFAFQVHVSQSTAEDWQPILPPHAATQLETDHAWKRFMRLSGILASQEEHAVVAKLCEAAVRQFEASSSLKVDAVRLIRTMVPNFEQDLLIMQGQREIVASSLGDEVLYQAKIVRFADGRLAFVPESNLTRAARSRLAPASKENSASPQP